MCMYPNCTERASGTGTVCQKHYRTLRAGVKSGKHTWSKYVALGMCTPLKQQKAGTLAERLADLESVIAQAVARQSGK